MNLLIKLCSVFHKLIIEFIVLCSFFVITVFINLKTILMQLLFLF